MTPADQSEVSIDSSAHSDLLSFVGAYWVEELDSYDIRVEADDLASKRGRSDVNHKHLVNLELLDLALALVSFRLDSKKSSEKEVLSVNFNDDVRHLARVADDLANESIGSGNVRVDLQANSDKTAWYCEHQVILVSHERGNLGQDLLPRYLTCL